MEIMKAFVKAHAKKIIWGLILTAITLGGYLIYKKRFSK